MDDQSSDIVTAGVDAASDASATSSSSAPASDVASATASAASDASAASGGPDSSSTLTDDHHDWASNFCNIDTRAGVETTGGASSGGTDNAGTAASGGGGESSDSGGIWGAIKGAASSVVDKAEDVASDVGHTVSDAATGVINTVGNVASDVGNTVSDAASGVLNTAETAASGIGHTVADAGSGLWNTATKVAGDVASGNIGDAIGDAGAGVAATAGHLVSDTAHAVVDTGSAALDAAGKVVTDTQQTVADAATGLISTAGNVVGDVARTVGDAAGPGSMIGQAADAVGSFANTAAGVAAGAVNTITSFNKGVVEGAVGGVEGLAKGLVNLGDSAGKEAYALATDANARAQALDTVEHGAEAVGQFAETAVTDPGKAAGEVGDAIESDAGAAVHMAGGIYDQYQQAAAAGHGAEFLGKGVGQAAVLVAGAVLTDGASVAAEGGAVAAEGAAALGEGAALAGEGAAALGEGAALAGEGASALGEGATTVEEAAAAAGEEGAAAAERAAGVTGDAPLPEMPEPSEFPANPNNPELNRPTYVPQPETPVPQGPGTAPTEFPSDPTQYPQPPGPAPDLGPGEPNPYKPYNPGQQPINPNIPRPPRLPEITPDPTRLPPGATPGPGASLAEDAADVVQPRSPAVDAPELTSLSEDAARGLDQPSPENLDLGEPESTLPENDGGPTEGLADSAGEDYRQGLDIAAEGEDGSLLEDGKSGGKPAFKTPAETEHDILGKYGSDMLADKKKVSGADATNLQDDATFKEQIKARHPDIEKSYNLDSINGESYQGKIFVNKDRANPGTAYHEQMHHYSSDTFKSDFGVYNGVKINEGVTEYFTRQIYSGPRKGIYDTEAAVAEALAKKVGDATLRKAYFQGDAKAIEAVKSALSK